MGFNHCAWLADDGFVWTSGNNKYGQLGLNDNTDRNRPSRIPNLPPISSVQSGYFATLSLDYKGKLWSFGWNNHGQLGLGDTTDRSSPQLVPGIPPVLSFSFHYYHTICLCEDRSIWSFGFNNYGQLGLGHETFQSAPVQLSDSLFPNEIISVKCGYHHSLFLTCEGHVLSCGSNNNGQLGQGDSTNRSTPTLIPSIKDCIQIACGGNISCVVDSSYRLWVYRTHFSTQTTPLCFTSVGLIQDISLGYQHTLCINQKGELWGWGNPSSGELGNSSIVPCAYPILLQNNIQDCLCVGNSSFIRNASGKDFCSGKNTTGQLGLGNTKNQLSFCKFLVKGENFSIWSRFFYQNVPKEEEEQFRMCYPVGKQKFSQKLERSALPLPE